MNSQWINAFATPAPRKRSRSACCFAAVRNDVCRKCGLPAEAPGLGKRPANVNEQHRVNNYSAREEGASSVPRATRPANPHNVGEMARKSLYGGLNELQAQAMMKALDGKSFFLTGGAGTGKSFTLNRIVGALKAKFGDGGVFVTASTGIAACHVGGTTLHSFSGVGLANGTVDELVTRVKNNRNSLRRWNACRVLVIDEVSMLDGVFLDKLEALATRLLCGDTVDGTRAGRRGTSAATFGGIQLILCGDFFQLPPVGLSSSSKVCFLFQSKCWSRAVPETIMLREVFRQADTHFVALLNEMRRGRLSEFHVNLLRHMAAAPAPLRAANAADSGSGKADAAEATLLFPNNESADRENARKLAELPGEPYTYEARDWPPDGRGQKTMEGCIAPRMLKIKLGAQVMLLKNLDAANQLVNGSRGIVVSFDKVEDEEKPSIVSGPETSEGGMLLPRVSFFLPNGGRIERLLGAEEWSVESGGTKIASRTQVPLKLSYALSIHKSQGMTLPAVAIDLANCFEPGHAYVALSRAVSIQTTRLLSFNPHRVHAHPDVIRFYEAQHSPTETMTSLSVTNSGSLGDTLQGGLTEEQRAKINANRAAALARRNNGGTATSAAAALPSSAPSYALPSVAPWPRGSWQENASNVTEQVLFTNQPPLTAGTIPTSTSVMQRLRQAGALS
ncbi:hypothetical protein AB1Y20_020515 [Prymnesium parvum]|uniref:ATP-dependent DNA helicase n=1 Tax=Prymnesium parvum TaxID=97485 RepID=A0AB34JVH2_PRYPA